MYDIYVQAPTKIFPERRDAVTLGRSIWRALRELGQHSTDVRKQRVLPEN